MKLVKRVFGFTLKWIVLPVSGCMIGGAAVVVVIMSISSGKGPIVVIKSFFPESYEETTALHQLRKTLEPARDSTNWVISDQSETLFILAGDVSGTMGLQQIQQRDNIIFSVGEKFAEKVLPHTRSTLMVWGIGTKVYFFGSANKVHQVEPILTRWRAFKAYRGFGASVKSLRSSKAQIPAKITLLKGELFPLDDQHTNISLAINSAIIEAIPAMREGIYVVVIVLTDGLHDPPKEQDEKRIRNLILQALNQKPVRQYAHRLKFMIVEIGKIPEHKPVTATILSEFSNAHTVAVSSWQEALPIVMREVQELTGEITWDQFPTGEHVYEFPTESEPIVFRFIPRFKTKRTALLGFNLVANGYPAEQHIVVELSDDGISYERANAMRAVSQKPLYVRVSEDPADPLPDPWFSDLWFSDTQYKFQLMVKPPVEGNLISFTIPEEQQHVVFTTQQPVRLWRYMPWFVAVGCLLLLTAFILIVRWMLTEDKPKKQRQSLVLSTFEVPVELKGSYEHQGQTRKLNGSRVKIGNLGLLESNSKGQVFFTPYASVRLPGSEVPLELERKHELQPEETVSLMDPVTQQQVCVFNFSDEEVITS